MTNEAGTEIELSTRWPNRPSPDDVIDDRVAPPPPIDVAGRQVLVWGMTRWTISWDVSDGTTAWLTHPAASDSPMPEEFVALVESVALVDEEEWFQSTRLLPDPTPPQSLSD